MATAASAQTLEVLGPAGPVAPDGFSVAVLKRGADGVPLPLASPHAVASGARLSPVTSRPPLATFRVFPEAGASEVRVQATEGGLKAEARFAVGPPAARVELQLVPPSLVKGRDTSAELTIRLRRPDGTPDTDSSPPVLRANVGTLAELQPVGAGVYRARYLLPDTRYPEVVIIAAFSAWPHPQSVHGAFGQLRVPLAAAIELPGRVEPHGRLSMEIAGVTYGPVEAGADGRVSLPVVVPPGHRYGTGTATDRLGNKRVGQVDLMLPPTDQLACVHNPTYLPADGVSHARVLCATSDPTGKPVASASVKLSALKGKLSGPRALEGGMLEWIYTSPSISPGGGDVLAAVWKTAGRVSQDELKVELVQGPAATFSLEVGERLVHYGGELPVEVHVKDGLGRPCPGARLELAATVGTFSAPQETAPGRQVVVWTPPAGGQAAEAELSLRATGPQGVDPARLLVWAREGELRAGVADLAGRPVPGQKLRVGGVELLTGEDGTVGLGPLRPGQVEVRHAQWPGLREVVHVLEGGLIFPEAPPLGTSVARLSVALAPPVPVNVRVQVTGHQVTYWVEDPKGKVLPEREVAVTLSGGSRGGSQVKKGRTSFTVTAAEPVTVSVADVQTGVTALAEVRP